MGTAPVISLENKGGQRKVKKFLVYLLLLTVTLVIPVTAMADGGIPIYGPNGEILKMVRSTPLPPPPPQPPSFWTVVNNGASLFTWAPIIITVGKAIFDAGDVVHRTHMKAQKETGFYDLYRGLGGR